MDITQTSFGVAGIARLFNYASAASGYDIMAWLPADDFDYYSESPRWSAQVVADYIRSNPEIVGRREFPPFVSEEEDILDLL